MPVFWPIPYACHVLYRTADEALVVLPRRKATCDTPTFRDQATMSANVIQPIDLRSASAPSWPSGSFSTPVSLIFVVSAVVLLWSAAEAVSILNTEPGS